ncbi:hypothetical protein HWV62_27323 [Athelia sp. TMB]|nr:hypothetical protein HWV62_27323 [Athelia sp. TMB]
MNLALLIAAIAALGGRAALAYELVQDYSGQTFFEGWDWYGNYDNTTLGDVWWLNETQATSQGLAYINSANNAIIKVDNSSNVAFNQKRNTVRITSQATYDIGSLWMIDLLHIPYGCSVWPAFWTFGPNWPEDGEIDIIEAVNLMDNNQMALPTHPTPPKPQLTTRTKHDPGLLPPLDADVRVGRARRDGLLDGRRVLRHRGAAEQLPQRVRRRGRRRVGDAVRRVWYLVRPPPLSLFLSLSLSPSLPLPLPLPLLLFVARVLMRGWVGLCSIWFWSRADVPASITGAQNGSLDISAWGAPSAAFPAGACNVSEFFTAQNLVLDITLCGDWCALFSPPLLVLVLIWLMRAIRGRELGRCTTRRAARPGPRGSAYVPSLPSPPPPDSPLPLPLQYNDNVVGPGSPKYDEAYFEISYVRAYTTPVPAPSAAGTGSAASAPAAAATTFSETGGGMGGSVVVVTGASAATATATGGGTSGGGRQVAAGWEWFGVVGVVGAMSGLVVVL